MNKREKSTFPKGFFTKSRPTISEKSALKDVIPFKWSKEVVEEKKEAVIYLANKKTI